MIGLLESCCHPHGITKVEFDENLIVIISIICITILLLVLLFLIYFNFFSKKKKELESLKIEHKKIQEKLTKAESELLTAKGIIEESTEALKKKENSFLDHCYTMAKSLEKGNEKQREDCWRIILHNNLDSIPDEMKKEYKIGKAE